MSDQGDNPFLISLPPALVPAPAVPETDDVDEVPQPTALIELPPGVETGTYKMPPSRDVAPASVPVAPPRFFPTPGAAILPSAPPAVVPEAPDAAREAEPPRAPQARVEAPPVAEEPEAATAPEVAPPAAAVPAESLAAPAAPTWQLVMPHGDVAVTVSGAVVIGRSPAVIPEYAQAQLVSASDPSRSVSKTHALLGIDGTGLWVADLGSTNGTFVITPGGGDVKVQPGSPVYVPAGSDIELGQYVIQVDHS